MNNLFTFFNNLFRSVLHAVQGFRVLIREEVNGRIHLVITAAALILACILHLTTIEWIIVVLLIGFVFALELMNTAIEHLANFVAPERNEKIKKIKDLAAAGVLIGAIAAGIIGLIIFIPKLIQFIKLYA